MCASGSNVWNTNNNGNANNNNANNSNGAVFGFTAHIKFSCVMSVDITEFDDNENKVTLVTLKGRLRVKGEIGSLCGKGTNILFAEKTNKYNVIPNQLYALFIAPFVICKMRWYWIKERHVLNNISHSQQSDDKNAQFDNYDKVFTFENLYSAALKCKRNVGWKGSVQSFMNEVLSNVAQLTEDLANRKFKITHKYNFDTF